MKHVKLTTQQSLVAPAVTGGSPLEIKLNGVMEIIDRLALAQRQSAWKISIGPTTPTNPTTPTLP